MLRFKWPVGQIQMAACETGGILLMPVCTTTVLCGRLSLCMQKACGEEGCNVPLCCIGRHELCPHVISLWVGIRLTNVGCSEQILFQLKNLAH